MQFSGSLVQSILHRNLSHASWKKSKNVMQDKTLLSHDKNLPIPLVVFGLIHFEGQELHRQKCKQVQLS